MEQTQKTQGFNGSFLSFCWKVRLIMNQIFDSQNDDFKFHWSNVLRKFV